MAASQQKSPQHYDVLVVGGGHAGVEAAAAAGRMGARVALLTMNPATIGEMSCNPAIGGLGKGHLVREIDAMDGLMGRAADRAGIQFRMLNRSRGAAVQGPRTQADRALYRAAIQNLLAEQTGVDLIEAAVGDLMVENGRLTGLMAEDGRRWQAPAAVLTTGTFLGGVIHLGRERTPAGRYGEAASNRLAERLRDPALGLPMARLKTGTPPRLDGRTIDWGMLQMQPGDTPPIPFSTLTTHITNPQISCGITRTTEETHRLIADNIHLSSIYSGQIEARGPRYCPSIEDKVVRFAARTSHQIFLEPEGLDDPITYPNGISTSLPPPVQEALVASIPGLGRGRIIRYGYAIEYDCIDPRGLSRRLEVKGLPGLFLAGQINGTTGYEEAAAQGLMAGINAVLRAGAMGGESPGGGGGCNDEGGGFILSRAEAYTGVMIDDLITRGAPEPYRMFTSRAEYRLLLRADNADQRLTDKAISVGVIGRERRTHWQKKRQALAEARAILAKAEAVPSDLRAHGLPVTRDGRRQTATDLLARDGIRIAHLLPLWPQLARIDPALHGQIETDCRYHGYVKRQEADIEALRRDESRLIPGDIDYGAIGGLSAESIDILRCHRPETIAQANRLPGLTPAAIVAVIRHLRRVA